MPLHNVLPRKKLPAQAAKVANDKTIPHRTAAVRRAPAPNTCVRKAHLHRVLLHQWTRAEEAPAAVAITEVATQAVLPAEAVPPLREARLQAQAAAQAAVTIAEAADQVQAATVLVAAEVVAVAVAEEDNFLPTSII